MKNKYRRYVLIFLCLLTLLALYISQQFDYYKWFVSLARNIDDYQYNNTGFIFNKSLRFFLNDTIMVMIIWLLYMERKYVRIAIYLELFGLLFLLPLYFVLKLTFEGTSEISSPLLSFLHRLVVNPTLLILLIPAIQLSRLQQRYE